MNFANEENALQLRLGATPHLLVDPYGIETEVRVVTFECGIDTVLLPYLMSSNMVVTIDELS
jgi:hypothetical protein